MGLITGEIAPHTIDVGGIPHTVTQLLSAESIEQRIGRMGASLANVYAGRDEIQIITVLNGARWFSSDLQAAMSKANPNLYISDEEIRISSYEGVDSTGQLTFHTALPDIADKDVIIAEDIYDTGVTLHGLTKVLLEQRPASLRVAVLLNKRTPGQTKQVPYGAAVRSCFRIGPKFVIGRGLDLNGQYRGLPDIHSLEAV